jgi:hypothetical protein
MEWRIRSNLFQVRDLVILILCHFPFNPNFVLPLFALLPAKFAFEKRTREEKRNAMRLREIVGAHGGGSCSTGASYKRDLRKL